jgi:hypothetical protein
MYQMAGSGEKMLNEEHGGREGGEGRRRGMHSAQRVGGKPEGKTLLGRPSCWLQCNIGICLREMEWTDMDWIFHVQDGD